MNKLKTDYNNGDPILASMWNETNEAVNKLMEGEGKSNVTVDINRNMLKVLVGDKYYILNGMTELVAPSVPTPNISSGDYDGSQILKLTSSNGAEIRYTTDGLEPTESSTKYTSSGISLSQDVNSESKDYVVKAKAWVNGEASELAVLTYKIFRKVATPTIVVSGDEYDTSRQITVSCGTSGASIKLSKDGGENYSDYASYSIDSNVSANSIKAKAEKEQWKTSSIATNANEIVVGKLKMYYGVMTGVPSQLSDITSLVGVKSQKLSSLKTSTDTKFDFAMYGSRAVFAFPSSIAYALSAIYDQNDFNQFSSFTRVEIGSYVVYYKTDLAYDSDSYNFVK